MRLDGWHYNLTAAVKINRPSTRIVPILWGPLNLDEREKNGTRNMTTERGLTGLIKFGWPWRKSNEKYRKWAEYDGPH